MKKLVVILPAIFPFLAAAPTLPADFSVVFVEAKTFFLSELLVSQTLHFSMFLMYRINYKKYQTISQWKPTDILKQNLMIKVYNWWIKWTWFADMYMVWKMKMCRSTCKFVRFTFKILKVSQIIVKKEVHKECVNY